MNEIHANDTPEFKNNDVNGFKDIKPQGDMDAGKAKSFWEDLFSGFSDTAENMEQEFYTTYEDRVKYTPKEDSVNGEWTGKRAESTFIPSTDSPEGKEAHDKLNEHGLTGIEYINGEPDFSRCSEANVRIDNMTENRHNYTDNEGNTRLGNYEQANIKCSELWNKENKDGRNDWTPEDVENYRIENKLTWHECCDTKSMNLVPREIHSFFTHSGGVAECKVRDGSDGGDFDE